MRMWPPADVNPPKRITVDSKPAPMTPAPEKN
jgi:hypothetical protein